MPATEKLTWGQLASALGGLYAARCGPYRFEICRMPDDTGYAPQMRPEDWPLRVWEVDGHSLDEANARAGRLADRHVPVIIGG
jgi:hypothetical protein